MSKGVCGRILSEVIHKSAKIPEMLNSRLILRGRSNFTIVNTGWSTKNYILNFCRNKTIDGGGLKDAFFLVCILFSTTTFSWRYLLNVLFFAIFPTIDLFYGTQLGWLWFYRWSCCQGGRVVLEILPEVDIVCAVIIIFVIIIFVIIIFVIIIFTICIKIIDITVIIIAMIFLPMGRVVLEILPEVDIVCAVIIIFVIIIFVIFIIDMIFLSMGAVVLEMLPDDRNDLANGSRGDVLIEILPKVEV